MQNFPLESLKKIMCIKWKVNYLSDREVYFQIKEEENSVSYIKWTPEMTCFYIKITHLNNYFLFDYSDYGETAKDFDKATSSDEKVKETN